MSKAKKNKKKTLPQGGAGIKMKRFELIYPRSAGVDVGSMLMVVSYTDREGLSHVRPFDSFTDSLHELAALLKTAGVQEVGMEATGSYWMTLFTILEDFGMRVTLINPSHYRNVAQKTDVNDAQWLHQLLSYGMLRHSHIADEPYRELRQYIHGRDTCKDQKSDTLNRIQKNLTQMNVKFQHLISDIEGVAGMKLLRLIAAGATDPDTLLAQVNHALLKASPEDLLSSLKGDYRPHLVTMLRLNLEAFDFQKKQMLAYETYIEGTLQRLVHQKDDALTKPIEKKKGLVRKNQYHFNLKDYLLAILGVDLTEVDGLDEIGLLTILSVTGTDMSKWPTANQFASWLNLSPRQRITGGRVVGHEKRVTHNPASQAFRLAAFSLWQNKGPLGQQYRKLAGTRGKKKAIKAIARKLAVIFYHMVLKQQPYDPKKIAQDPEKQLARKIARLQKDAAKLGWTLQKVS
ncbi:IS110 family RNA-guided transposase [Mucilaginibacter paludis]|uniref:ISPpu9, transposase n=1 Tax=Mucilaginibacter paludis DSM 18603 TaxID=714943 RepID=H1Y180_9SPHI|nr:IS110 family transposase [Mucilaginibacter paludis]EHQ27630.1 ISPpu9, transposase [Mucilaginibacter paludis DSM 18603]EHQ29715.1 LOW QUALITY PROTEIN: hypothetical protein Mucpa_5646 [Mucilaginibacter paludis DSM 18603]